MCRYAAASKPVQGLTTVALQTLRGDFKLPNNGSFDVAAEGFSYPLPEDIGSWPAVSLVNAGKGS